MLAERPVESLPEGDLTQRPTPLPWLRERACARDDTRRTTTQSRPIRIQRLRKKGIGEEVRYRGPPD